MSELCAQHATPEDSRSPLKCKTLGGKGEWRQMTSIIRRVSIVTNALVIVTFTFCLHAAFAQETRCNEIESIDPENLRVEMPDGIAVQLKNGAAFHSDTVESGGSEKWELSLVQDELIRPAPGQVLRLMKLFDNHLTGSGSWDNVFIFQCAGGKVVPVFRKSFLYGAKVQKITEAELIFTSGEWMTGDAMCCPSKERISTYQWTPKDVTYRLVRSVLRPAQKK